MTLTKTYTPWLDFVTSISVSPAKPSPSHPTHGKESREPRRCSTRNCCIVYGEYVYLLWTPQQFSNFNQCVMLLENFKSNIQDFITNDITICFAFKYWHSFRLALIMCCTSVTFPDELPPAVRPTEILSMFHAWIKFSNNNADEYVTSQMKRYISHNEYCSVKTLLSHDSHHYYHQW